MTSTDQRVLSPSHRPCCPPRVLEIENLPYVVLRELLPMLDTASKMTLRLVSQNLRDLIDTQRNIQFNVKLSDYTSSTVLRFNHFDFHYFPRVLHKLQVTVLLSPLEIFSTSVSRCPLPPQIHTLEFKFDRLTSQENFIKLLHFYGRPNRMKRLKLDMMAVTKVEDVAVVRQGLKLDFLTELELTFPPTFHEDVRFPRLLLGGTFPALHTLSINLKFGPFYPFLYKDFYLFLGRHLTSLKVLDVLHPSRYNDPKLLSLTKSPIPLWLWTLMDPYNPEGVERLAKTFALQPQTRQTFQEQCDTSRVTNLSLNIPWNEVAGAQGANLGLTFLQAQKHLVNLELQHFPCSAETCGMLTQLIENCAQTLVTLKLIDVIKARGALWGEENDDPVHFDLRCVERCTKLKTFVWTCDNLHLVGLGLAQLRLRVPDDVENLLLPCMENHELENAGTWMTKLKSFEFQRSEFVVLEKIQILLGDEGFPSLEKVTLSSDQWEWRRIRDWVKGRGVPKPLRDITITKVTEVERFTGRKVNKVVLSRTPLTRVG